MILIYIYTQIQFIFLFYYISFISIVQLMVIILYAVVAGANLAVDTREQSDYIRLVDLCFFLALVSER